MVERKEELESFLVKMKENEKTDIKLSIKN